MNEQNESVEKKTNDFWKKDIFIFVRSIGYLLMLFGSIGMFGNVIDDATPFAFFGFGLVLYLIGKEH